MRAAFARLALEEEDEFKDPWLEPDKPAKGRGKRDDNAPEPQKSSYSITCACFLRFSVVVAFSTGLPKQPGLPTLWRQQPTWRPRCRHPSSDILKARARSVLAASMNRIVVGCRWLSPPDPAVPACDYNVK